MAVMNAQTALTGLASFSKIITLASVVCVVVFSAIAILPKLRFGRHIHLSLVQPGLSSQAGMSRRKGWLRPRRASVESNVHTLRPEYGRSSPFDDDYIPAPVYEGLSVAAGSGVPSGRGISAPEDSEAMRQVDRLSTEYVSSHVRSRSPGWFVDSEKDVDVLEEAYRRKSAPDTGPGRAFHTPDVAYGVETSREAPLGPHEFEHADIPSQRSPGAHRRSR